VRRRIDLCDRLRGGKTGLGLATLVPGLAARIALAGASHSALLDYACCGSLGEAGADCCSCACYLRSSWLAVDGGRDQRRQSAASPGRAGSGGRPDVRGWWRSIGDVSRSLWSSYEPAAVSIEAALVCEQYQIDS
jgi:hypothetical protein